MTGGLGTRAGAVGFLLCVVLVVADRWSWAKAVRWGEDHAVALRLAESLPWHPPRVSILNSRYDPNPNGLVWAAWPFTALGSFQTMAFVLAMTQVGALVVLATSMLPPGARWPALLAVLSSMPLRYATELWPNWMLVTPVGVGLASLLAYRRSPRPYWFALSFAATLVCGALYLPGVVTLLAFVALWIVLLASRRDTRWRFLLPVAATLILVAMVLSFGPYLAAVDVRALHPAEPRPVSKRLMLAAYEAVAGPIAMLRLAAGMPWMNTMVVPGPDFAALDTTIALAGAALWAQVGVTTAMYARAAVRGGANSPALGGFSWAAALVVTVCLLMPLVTGQVPSRDDRGDLLVQIVPVMLILVFSSPLALDDGSLVARAAVRATMGIVAVFALASAVGGHRLATALASPPSTVITRPGQPGWVMEAAVAAVARDWGEVRDGPIPIEYHTDRGPFALTGEWIARHAAWHARPLKVGEGFDLALERVTGRRNACGRRCPDGTGRYVVALADEAMPNGSREVWSGQGLRVWRIEP